IRFVAGSSRHRHSPRKASAHAGCEGSAGPTTDMVAKSAPDGYTLLFTYAAHYSQTMVQATPYDPVKDFEPVAQLVDTQLVMAVRADSPFKTVADVIAAAKAKPGSVSYGFAGIGTTGHMCGALFEKMAGVQLNAVPYKAASQVPIDAASGQTDLMFGGTASAMPLIRDGRLRVLATTGSMRTEALPGSKTLAELALPGYEVSSPVWMMAPRGTPPAIIRKLSDELVRIASTPAFKEMALKLAIDPAPLNSEALSANVPREIIKWRRLVDLTQPSGK
ncbi:MAG: tripartite tricarboxylate transporter substrate binding protein, partial [Anaerolineae bacterium]|nr:tripartite tricarboxylate transporter substrate binding protein [Anaerolineae bacterium]